MKDIIRNIEIQKEIMEEESYNPFIIEFYYNHKGTLFGFKAAGETGFSQYGLYIVAAGVSALIINTVNSLRLLTDETTEDEVQRNYIQCILPNLKKNKGSKEGIILLRALRLGVRSIQETYGDKYVTIVEIREEKKSSILKIFK
ncbi:ribosomal-processing cysteine protease Prp [Paenibacillus elgii]|uniref:ribosomal-processing cysteine protease Prp n=1 Tax=Paenibacillus elgii TaxID=189691 RepID=UPI000FD872E1|nr:ribosomal-processing cysteine protease Prp [Paenibacillus elgii]NEN87381.1 ribosomal-processing cysteine protease Prp [Paenibacillus elgii]